MTTLYRNHTQCKQAFINEVFKPFCESVMAGPVWHFADLVYNQYTIEDFAYHDDCHYFNVLSYFSNKVVPHKIAVFRAGMDLWKLDGFERFIKTEYHEWKDQLWLHDISKFSANESFGYAFYNFQSGSGKHGFDLAWNHHKHHNPHHPEHWLSVGRDGEVVAMEMPRRYVAEMVADWIGAGETYGQSLADWLPKNLPKFLFHDKTAASLRALLEMIGIEVETINNRLHVKRAIEQLIP